ncbi:MAG: response regulator transcription factor [Clostridia bacterium]|nr:response regulator transcription factor [Clostridia bacterium]
MKRVLIVEDEDAIREFEAINLKRAGYETVEANSGEAALEIFNTDVLGFDIALLDIMMPGIDGITVCKEIRKVNQSIGIIMLTAKSQEMDKISGLMTGADDYVTKPFSPAELLARVDSLYRRVTLKSEEKVSGTNQIIRGEFVLDIRKRTLSRNGKNIELTQVEFQMMEYFFANPDIPLSREKILTQVWGQSYYGEEKIVDVNIRRLRMKIEDDPSFPRYLVTVWGQGYKWNTD